MKFKGKNILNDGSKKGKEAMREYLTKEFSGRDAADFAGLQVNIRKDNFFLHLGVIQKLRRQDEVGRWSAVCLR